MEDTKIDYHSVKEILSVMDYVWRTKRVYLDKNKNQEKICVNDDGEDLDAGGLAQNNAGTTEDNSEGIASGEENGDKPDRGMEEEEEACVILQKTNSPEKIKNAVHSDAHDKLDHIVVRLQGLTNLLRPMTTAQKNEFLDIHLLLTSDKRLVYDALDLILLEFFYQGSKLERSFLVKMKKTIAAIVDIVNEQVLHPTMKNWSKACEDFLAEVSSLSALAQCSSAVWSFSISNHP